MIITRVFFPLQGGTPFLGSARHSGVFVRVCSCQGDEVGNRLDRLSGENEEVVLFPAWRDVAMNPAWVFYEVSACCTKSTPTESFEVQRQKVLLLDNKQSHDVLGIQYL